MAGRPPGGQPAHNENLIDFDYGGPTYYSGAPPPANDDQLLHHYDMNNSEAHTQPQGRPSISYDDFVGGGRSTAGLPGGPGAPSATPYATAMPTDRQYSQASDTHNYQRYSDADIEDDQSMYYATGGNYDEPPAGVRRAQSQKNNRNSLLSMGGGLSGRVKNMLGRGPEYSEMDLPLTEHAAQQSGTAAQARGLDEGIAPPKKRSSGVFKFGFGRGAPRPLDTRPSHNTPE